jgi:hypothetical protein
LFNITNTFKIYYKLNILLKYESYNNLILVNCSNEGKKTIDITTEFRQNKKGVDWLNSKITDPNIQKINGNILNTNLQTGLMNGKEKIASKSTTNILKENDTINQEFYKNIKSNNSNENWDDLVTDVEQEKDIICLYRKTSNDTKITKSEDWKKLLNIAKGFTIYSIKNDGSKYLICLKKENVNEISTATSILDITEASSQKEIEFNGIKNRRNSKNKNININKTVNLHNSDENCDEDEDNYKIDHTDDISCLGNNKSSTTVLKNISHKYAKNKINSPNYLQEYILEKNVNKNSNFINNEFRRLYKRQYSREHRPTYGINFKTLKTIKQYKMFILLSGPRNIYKIKQLNKIILLLKTSPKLIIKNLNPLFYKNKRKDSFNKRISAILFIYLYRLHPLISIRLLNLFQNENLLSQIIVKYNQGICSCTNEPEISLLPLGLLTLLQHFCFQISKIDKQINKANGFQYYNSPHIKTHTTGSNLLIQQPRSKLLITSDLKDFNAPIDMNIHFIHPIQNKNKNNIKPTSIYANTNSKQFFYDNIENVYKANINNANKNIEMRMMNQDLKDTNNATTESSMKIESTTQYLNVLNESTNINTSIDESTSIQNDVTESTE